MKPLTAWMVGQASPVPMTPEELTEFTASLNNWLSSPREWMVETTTVDMTNEQLGWRRIGARAKDELADVILAFAVLVLALSALILVIALMVMVWTTW